MPLTIITAIQQLVQKAYIATLGRPADPDGLDYWSKRIEEGTTEAELLAIMLASREFAEEFREPVPQVPGASNMDKLIAHIYEKGFSRPPDPAGLDFFKSMASTQQLAPQKLVETMLAAAAGRDKQTLDNKIDAAKLLTEKLKEQKQKIEGKKLEEQKKLAELHDALLKEQKETFKQITEDAATKPNPAEIDQKLKEIEKIVIVTEVVEVIVEVPVPGPVVEVPVVVPVTDQPVTMVMMVNFGSATNTALNLEPLSATAALGLAVIGEDIETLTLTSPGGSGYLAAGVLTNSALTIELALGGTNTVWLEAEDVTVLDLAGSTGAIIVSPGFANADAVDLTDDDDIPLITGFDAGKHKLAFHLEEDLFDQPIVDWFDSAEVADFSAALTAAAEAMLEEGKAYFYAYVDGEETSWLFVVGEDWEEVGFAYKLVGVGSGFSADNISGLEICGCGLIL